MSEDSEDKKLSDQIRHIIKLWGRFNLTDVAGMINLRRTLSVYYYNLTELKTNEERAFIKAETDRKIAFNISKHEAINEGMTATKATSHAEVQVSDLRIKEIEHERLFKTYKDYISSIEQVLNAISSAIRQAENENKQGSYHT